MPPESGAARAEPLRTYPVNLVVAGQRCLVVGAGKVAAGKVVGLLRAGAAVTVVAPDIDPQVEQLASEHPVALERRAYRRGEAAAFRLVVTATGVPSVDAGVAADATAAGVWVNSADDPANCTFVLPAIHRDGPVTVAVSTGGASPALASWLRRRLAEACGDGVGTLAELLAAARGKLKTAARPTTSVDWQALLDGPLPELVRDGRITEARQILDDAVRRGLEPRSGYCS